MKGLVPIRIQQAVVLRGLGVEWARYRALREGWVLDRSGLEPCETPADPSSLEGPASFPATAAAAVRHLGRRPVLLVTPASCAIQRILSVPSSDEAEIAGMIELQLESLSPFPVESLLHSFEVLGADGGSARVLVVLTPRKAIENAGAPFRQQGVRFSRVTVSTYEWWHAFHHRRLVPSEGRHLFLVASPDGCEFLLVESGVPLLMRALPHPPEQSPDAFAAEAADELSYSLTALSLEAGDAPLASATLYSEPDALPLAAAFRRCLAIPLREEQAPGRLAELAAQREAEGPPRRLDLTPPEWREEEHRRQFRRRLAAATAGGILLWAVLVAALEGWVQWQQNHLDQREAELAAVRHPAQELRDLMSRVDALARYRDTTYSALECLREIALLMPPGVELRQYKFEKGRAITLTGEAPVSQPIYDFKKALDTSPFFRFQKRLENPTRSGGRENFRMAIALREDIE
jgi:hypothetical protein